MLPAPGNARGRLGSSGSSRVRERLKDRRQREGGRERGKNRKLLRNTSGLTLSAPPTHTQGEIWCVGPKVWGSNHRKPKQMSLSQAPYSVRKLSQPLGWQLSAQQEMPAGGLERKSGLGNARLFVAGSKQERSIASGLLKGPLLTNARRKQSVPSLTRGIPL